MTSVYDSDSDTTIQTTAEASTETNVGGEYRREIDTDTRPDPASNRVSVVPFDLQGDRYCVETERIATALGVTLDGSLRDADDPWYAGKIELEGLAIRVVDLVRVFASGTVSRPDDPKLLVCESTDDANTHYGWLVDAIDVVTTVDTATLAHTRSRAGRRFVNGRLEHDGEPWVFLDERALNA